MVEMSLDSIFLSIVYHIYFNILQIGYKSFDIQEQHIKSQSTNSHTDQQHFFTILYVFSVNKATFFHLKSLSIKNHEDIAIKLEVNRV